VQMSSHQEIVLSANCNCSAETHDIGETVDDVIGGDELDNVMHGAVNVSQLGNAGVKVELPDELLNT